MDDEDIEWICKCRKRFCYMFNELGKVQIDDLRVSPYVQTKDNKETMYLDWLQYIQKEYGTYSVREKNLFFYDASLNNFFYKSKVGNASTTEKESL